MVAILLESQITYELTRTSCLWVNSNKLLFTLHFGVPLYFNMSYVLFNLNFGV